ncbi:hypothetical protein [Solimicrobium silvestre]|uniref:RelA/SpoT domain-containing protein n=1 Tax=Solimicrobium silvestre TaxID=2099400 RepID=A0A2S9GWM1_9BURK|nr:hypothetical protein [Solimicrobium silvestre]PRC92127.1 hypothetical protein S2091_3262 [Solimicrobium silvestre]
MNSKITLGDFLLRNNILREEWLESKLNWDTLLNIGMHHETQISTLEDHAKILANAIQKFALVHSVKWRVKNTEHLLVKIIRKCAKNEPKYSAISVANYAEIVMDLIGIRVIHLFKSDFFNVDQSIRNHFSLSETAITYYREGDDKNYLENFKTPNFELKIHPVGYRSIHYVIKETVLKKLFFAEIQVRTIFEEGWSEIDHKIRYPNHTDNKYLQYFLAMFNRMAGSADEMGEFVKGLEAEFTRQKQEIDEASKAQNSTLEKVERMVEELQKHKEKNAKSNKQVENLQAEIKKLRGEQNLSIAISNNFYTGQISEVGKSIRTGINFDHGLHNAHNISKPLFEIAGRSESVITASRLISTGLPATVSTTTNKINFPWESTPLTTANPFVRTSGLLNPVITTATDLEHITNLTNSDKFGKKPW